MCCTLKWYTIFLRALAYIIASKICIIYIYIKKKLVIHNFILPKTFFIFLYVFFYYIINLIVFIFVFLFFFFSGCRLNSVSVNIFWKYMLSSMQLCTYCARNKQGMCNVCHLHYFIALPEQPVPHIRSNRRCLCSKCYVIKKWILFHLLINFSFTF